MTQPIAGTYSTLVTPGSVSDNPTTIAATGLLNDGLRVNYQGLTVVNAGGIAAEGVTFTAGGSITNQSGGTISGHYGVYGYGGAVTVVNAGSISGSTTAGPLAGAARVLPQPIGIAPTAAEAVAQPLHRYIETDLGPVAEAIDLVAWS